MVTLTDTQQQIVEATAATANRSSRNLVVAGLAGAGKTTALVEGVRGIIDAGLRPCVCAPTGKAASVINKKQNIFTAATIHSRLTRGVIDVDAKKLEQVSAFSRRLEDTTQADPLTEDEKKEYSTLLEQLDANARKVRTQNNRDSLKFELVEVDDFLDKYDCLVFDESSMIGKHKIYPMIDRIPVPKIFFGDSAQLPPVKDFPAIDLQKPDYYLDKILRQAGDSPIIPLSHYIHNKRDYPHKSKIACEDIHVIDNNREHVVAGYEKTHQVIVWTNKERYSINKRVRAAHGFDFASQKYPFLPMVGEKLVVDENDTSMNLLKGQLITVTEVQPDWYNPNLNPYIVRIAGEDETGYKRDFIIGMVDMAETYQVPNTSDERRAKHHRIVANKCATAMRWSYCFTCHNAQGSEWENVMVINSMPPGNKEWAPWTYTAVTRARKHLVLADYQFKLMR